MIPVFLDFETFWSKTHNLTKLGPFHYVSHPDTELISCALRVGNERTRVVFGQADIEALLATVDWSDAFAIAHNMSSFDALILAWRLRIRPRMWGCTLAMAKPLHAKTTGCSLGALTAHYGLGVKDNRILLATQGKHLADFTPDELRAMRVYNADDTDQCAGVFYKLLPHYSAQELWHIHQKIQNLVACPLELDVPLLQDALQREQAQKRQALQELAVVLGIEDNSEDCVRAEMASAPKFAALLERHGVPVPMKPSPRHEDKLIPALAKTDEGMQALTEDPNELVAHAARVRLQVKSTITETRLQAFIAAAGFCGGKWPVTSHYCGADTTGRASGWHYNPLNLPKVNPKHPRISDALRGSIRAPKGHVIVVADLSGIEMRFNHHLWRVPYSTELWRAKPDADTYRAYAARKLGCAPEEVTGEQRFASKVENLGLGFGMGGPKYQATARILSQGKLLLTHEEAVETVRAWRELHPEIVAGWKKCHQALDYIATGKEFAIDPWGLFTTCREGIRLPSGRIIQYPHLRVEKMLKWPHNPDGTVNKSGEPEVKIEWVYGEGRHKTRIYAGKIDENIVQAGSRDVMYEILFDIYKETGIGHVHEVYDEGIWVVPTADADDFLQLVQMRMRRAPIWWPQLVTWSEGAVGESYAECK